MELKMERYAEGRYFVRTKPPFPRRVGHIIGGRSVWLAEAGQIDLGYFKSRKAALEAISKEVDE